MLAFPLCSGNKNVCFDMSQAFPWKNLCESEEFLGIFYFRPQMYSNSLLKATYIMKHTWISRPQSHLNIGSNLAQKFKQIPLKRVCLKQQQKKSFICSDINTIIKSWWRILKARCILLRNYQTEVIPREFNYEVLESRWGVNEVFSFSLLSNLLCCEDISLRPLNIQIHHKSLGCHIQPLYSTTARIQGCRMLVE